MFEDFGVVGLCELDDDMLAPLSAGEWSLDARTAPQCTANLLRLLHKKSISPRHASHA